MELHGKVDLDSHPTADRSAVGESVPVIDISDLGEGSPAVRTIAGACQEWGFFQNVGHGVPAEEIRRVWQQTRDFFASSSSNRAVANRV